MPQPQVGQLVTPRFCSWAGSGLAVTLMPLARPLRDALGLAPGARLQASIDRQGRLVLVPSKVEPEDLFLHRPKVNRCLSLEQMEEAIAAAAGRSDDREDA